MEKFLENQQGHLHGEALPELLGTAPAFKDAVSRLPSLAEAEGAVLISGETGTGKELVARAIHALSPRPSSAFVAVNCGSLVDTLVEGELFGHERGAFTDAHGRRQGLIAHAAGGTLFLDEAETLTRRAQVTLLRVLQDGSYRPLGSSVEQRVDVRFLAATNVRLESLVEAGVFRADLYYRLCVFSITLPPLRERRDDVLVLAEHFLAKHRRPGRPAPQLSAAAAGALLAFDWPGNVRELESAILRSLHLARSGTIEVEDLGLPGRLPALPVLSGAPRSYKTQKRQLLDAFDSQYLIRVMTEYRGNVSQAAQAAGKERRDFGKLLKRHGLDRRQFLA
jgi:DNA-binding NtrC family response regulator